jgi:very-short-patch-repair endonuclease
VGVTHMERNKLLIQNARCLRRDMTPAEWIVWDILRGPQCKYRFRRQHPIPPYIADFYCPELRVVIEVDGGQHGGANDQKRDAFLQENGYRILRFWNNDVLNNRDGVWARIEQSLNDLGQLPRVTPTLTLPLNGGGKVSRSI